MEFQASFPEVQFAPSLHCTEAQGITSEPALHGVTSDGSDGTSESVLLTPLLLNPHSEQETQLAASCMGRLLTWLPVNSTVEDQHAFTSESAALHTDAPAWGTLHTSPHTMQRSANLDMLELGSTEYEHLIPNSSSDDPAPTMYELVRDSTSHSDPRSPVSDAVFGLPSRLKRQASVPPDTKKTCLISALRLGRAGLKDGTYLFVVMVAAPHEIRLIHEEHLRVGDWNAGHSS